MPLSAEMPRAMTLATPLARFGWEGRPPLKRIRGRAIAPQPNSATVPALVLGGLGGGGDRAGRLYSKRPDLIIAGFRTGATAT
jgi:hypothetical protein